MTIKKQFPNGLKSKFWKSFIADYANNCSECRKKIKKEILEKLIAISIDPDPRYIQVSIKQYKEMIK